MGITGHRTLGDPAAWNWVRGEIDALLRNTSRPLVGVTSLAIGADQLFAEIILELKGDIAVVIPFADYERTFDNNLDRNRYRRLKALSMYVETLPNYATEDEAYLRAGQRIVDLSDWLIAVWDGQPARGLGGTADIVPYAAATGKHAVQLNPISYRIEY